MGPDIPNHWKIEVMDANVATALRILLQLILTTFYIPGQNYEFS